MMRSFRIGKIIHGHDYVLSLMPSRKRAKELFVIPVHGDLGSFSERRRRVDVSRASFGPSAS